MVDSRRVSLSIWPISEVYYKRSDLTKRLLIEGIHSRSDQFLKVFHYEMTCFQNNQFLKCSIVNMYRFLLIRSVLLWKEAVLYLLYYQSDAFFISIISFTYFFPSVPISEWPIFEFSKLLLSNRPNFKVSSIPVKIGLHFMRS